jgi:hypothetical protein
MSKLRPLDLHEEACQVLISAVAQPERLQRIEGQAAEVLAAAAPALSAGTRSTALITAGHTTGQQVLGSLEILTLLGFGAGDAEKPLLHPLQLREQHAQQASPRYHTPEDDAHSTDVYRAKVSCACAVCALLRSLVGQLDCAFASLRCTSF